MKLSMVVSLAFKIKIYSTSSSEHPKAPFITVSRRRRLHAIHLLEAYPVSSCRRVKSYVIKETKHQNNVNFVGA